MKLLIKYSVALVLLFSFVFTYLHDLKAQQTKGGLQAQIQEEQAQEEEKVEQTVLETKFKKHKLATNTKTFELKLILNSLYNFRGHNVFQKERYQDQYAVFYPSLKWFVLNSGLWISYATLLQVNGKNLSFNVKNGIGFEQRASIGFTHEFTSYFKGTGYLRYYFFPFSNKAYTGLINPSYLEPGVLLSLISNNNGGLNLLAAYYAGVQHNLDERRYFYFKPSLSKLFEFSEKVAIKFNTSVGYKIYTKRKQYYQNLDVLMDALVNYKIEPDLILETGVHISATNLRFTIGDFYAVWFSVGILADL